MSQSLRTVPCILALFSSACFFGNSRSAAVRAHSAKLAADVAAEKAAVQRAAAECDASRSKPACLKACDNWLMPLSREQQLAYCEPLCESGEAVACSSAASAAYALARLGLAAKHATRGCRAEDPASCTWHWQLVDQGHQRPDALPREAWMRVLHKRCDADPVSGCHMLFVGFMRQWRKSQADEDLKASSSFAGLACDAGHRRFQTNAAQGKRQDFNTFNWNQDCAFSRCLTGNGDTRDKVYPGERGAAFACDQARLPRTLQYRFREANAP